ncbi:AAA family ATPase [Stenomitos frigidus]|uniref:Uncharacterized protein n=1 Tax=Stenomitos frigidus ULC18 TaxID=2107698 RepID=A0A2T1E6X3_9CYAN|nr:AAA family ATPase [Stenomitos frigidus]PSB28487.1 hypothetical protein C7B82_13555 [Stenomitos frigidus ULC18]
MQSDSIEPFSDNWAYLKAELLWLDRLLGMAIARQRHDTKVVDRAARSRVDRVTSHWWKGLVTLEGETAYDSPAERPGGRSTPAKGSYQQQLEAKIKVSQRRGVLLGVPSLCSRLQLSVPEKNLVLMALAPEISRRYARLYNYLQETEHPGATGLPTVDLILRMLCRTDVEWRSLRRCMTGDSALLQYQLLELRSSQADPLLSRLVRLSDPLVNYLLADQPDSNALEALLHPLPTAAPTFLISSSSPLPTPHSPLPTLHRNLWSKLILPPPLLVDLEHLCHRVQFAQQVDEDWGFAAVNGTLQTVKPGSIALLCGASGTGKTMAAQAIAQRLQTPLCCIDLAQLQQDDIPHLLQEIAIQAPTVLLLKAAQSCFGRTSLLADALLHQFLQVRQQHRGLTLLSVHQKHHVTAQWRRQINPFLDFPLPDRDSRFKLWQQAFPEDVPLDATIEWEWLADQFVLSGGDIQTITRDAAIQAAALETNVTTEHLIQACERAKGRQGRQGKKF